MTNDRSINFTNNGTYNKSINIQGNYVAGNYIEGDFVQGDKIQGDQVQGNKLTNKELDAEIIEIKRLLNRYQAQYSKLESQQQTAETLAEQARRDPARRNKLIQIANYLATNGGIEAVISQVIGLALKALGIPF